MLPRGHGAILFTGASASVKGYAQSAPFAMGKFALRGLAQSMARELSPQGIHVAHVVIDGGIRSAQPRRAAGQARQHARSGRHRADLSASAAAATQRLGLGNRAAALGGEILEPPRLCAANNRAMPETFAKAALFALALVDCRDCARADDAPQTRARRSEPAVPAAAGGQTRQRCRRARCLQRPALLAGARPMRRHLFQAQRPLYRCRGARARGQARPQGQRRVHQEARRGDQDCDRPISTEPSVS